MKIGVAGLASIFLIANIGREVSGGVTTYTFTDLYTVETPAGFTSIQVLGRHPVVGGTVGGYGNQSGNSHALLWDASQPVDLNPTGYSSSRILGDVDGEQVGGGTQTGGSDPHALIWKGTSNAMDLNPTGFTSSAAWSADGDHVVGWGFKSDFGADPNNGSQYLHALFWDGHGNFTDLNPNGYVTSEAYAIRGDIKAGWAVLQGQTTLSRHAMMWNASNVAIDLNPTGWQSSFVWDTDGNYEIGNGQIISSGPNHALLWHSTNLAVDLNPDGFTSSAGADILGDLKIGWGFGAAANNVVHALLWDANNTATDLGALLPDSFGYSYAFHFDVAGNIFGLAQDTDQNWHAVEWSVVPEPSCLSLIILGGADIETMLPRWENRKKGNFPSRI